MLVLRRKVGEAMVLDGVITVYVLAVEGERVKIGIAAPPDVGVVRQELLAASDQQQALLRKQDALAQETNPRKQEQLQQSIARLERSLTLGATLAPASPKAQQE
jgi:carbon storage regulator